MVVDGRVGFTGRHEYPGPGIGSRAALKRMPSPDLHFKIEGPVVLELQEIFLEDWYFATKESLAWLAHPHQLLPGESVCRAVSGGPNEDFEKINWIPFRSSRLVQNKGANYDALFCSGSGHDFRLEYGGIKGGGR